MRSQATRVVFALVAAGLLWPHATTAAGPAKATPTPVPAAPLPFLAMQEPEYFPHAGITIALPKGFESVTLTEPFEVFRAQLNDRSKMPQTIALQAFPIEEQATAEAYAEAMVIDAARNPLLHNFRAEGKAEMKAAGLPATAVRVSQTLRGVDVVAIHVYFVRQSPDGKFRLCYVLGFASDAERQGDLQAFLTETLKSVQLAAVKHPSAATVLGPGSAIDDDREGFSIRPPRGWYVSQARPEGPPRIEWSDKMPLVRSGLAMAQVDHLLGGETGAELTVVTTDQPPEEGNPQACAERLVKACDVFAPPSKLVAESAANLAGAVGYQVILRPIEHDLASRLPDASDTGVRPVVVVRGACLPVCGGQARKGYVLILRCQVPDADAPGPQPGAPGAGAVAAEMLMNKLAASFMSPAAMSQPATSPATRPATAPATSRTASQAASMPAYTPTSTSSTMPEKPQR